MCWASCADGFEAKAYIPSSNKYDLAGEIGDVTRGEGGHFECLGVQCGERRVSYSAWLVEERNEERKSRKIRTFDILTHMAIDTECYRKIPILA